MASENWPRWIDQKHNKVRAIRITATHGDAVILEPDNSWEISEDEVVLEDGSRYSLNDELKEMKPMTHDYLMEKEDGTILVVPSRYFEGSYAADNSFALRGDFTDDRSQAPRV